MELDKNTRTRLACDPQFDDETVKIKVPIRTLMSALSALEIIYNDCMNSDDEHAVLIDSAYWGNDFYDLKESAESGLKAKYGKELPK